MERHEVIAVLESLANGVDPATGQNIPLDMSQGTLDALSIAGALLKEDEIRRPRRNPTFPAAGAPWTEEEDQRLLAEHDSGMTAAQMALAHGRTSNSITLRLIKLGRIDPATAKVRKRGTQPAAPAN